ncbi:hypothetical protein RND64_05295 [Gordonia sp. w5E2]|uniref:hypothetical protein n=1 Tax=Gordonia TaxID=2053 RepID=UPI0022E2C939|nr:MULTISPECIES: hypothetical protein [Gordonia]
MGSTQGQVVANGAFALFSRRRVDDMSELLESIFGRDDITAVGADWRGIVYFTLDDDEELAPDTVVGFDPSSGASGPLATIDEVLAAVRDGEIAEAVDVSGFDAWRIATGTRELAMGDCVPPLVLEFLGGDPAERADEPQDLITYVAVAAALMGRLEALGVQPGDDIPPEVFDDERWS